jgi:pyrimidine-nucleoside phosphorylase
MRSWLLVAHYVHAEAADRWAPLDGRLFRLRQQHGLQAVTPLVVASILAKKKALNLERAGVEIRRGPFGNLGNDDRNLKHAADLFEVVAERLNIRCTTTITGDGRPYQGKIGRGEALIAVSEILNGASSQDLADHVTLCEKLAERVIGQPVEWSPKSLREAFMRNLEVQGSSYRAFTERVDRVLTQPRRPLLSRGSGILQWDLGSVREAIMKFQSPVPGDVDAAGVDLLTLGGPVDGRQCIASVRGNPQLVEVLQSAYSLTR